MTCLFKTPSRSESQGLPFCYKIRSQADGMGTTRELIQLPVRRLENRQWRLMYAVCQKTSDAARVDSIAFFKG